MTGDEFRARYQLLRRVTTGAVRTFHAVGPGGAVVMVHVLESEDVAPELEALVVRLGDADRAKVLETFDVEGSPVIVTKFILDFETLEAWLRTRAAAAPAPEPSGAPPAIAEIGAPRAADPAPSHGPPASDPAPSDAPTAADAGDPASARAPGRAAADSAPSEKPARAAGTPSDGPLAVPDAPDVARDQIAGPQAGLTDTFAAFDVEGEPSPAPSEPPAPGLADAAPPEPAEPVPNERAEPADSEAGEFTKLFRAMQSDPESDSGEAHASSPASHDDEPRQGAPPAAPGRPEAPQGAPPGAPQGAPPEPPVPPRPGASEPPATPAPSASPAADAGAEPASDTEPDWLSIGDSVGADVSKQAGPEGPPSTTPAPVGREGSVPAADAPKEPSEFTRLFEAMAPEAPTAGPTRPADPVSRPDQRGSAQGDERIEGGEQAPQGRPGHGASPPSRPAAPGASPPSPATADPGASSPSPAAAPGADGPLGEGPGYADVFGDPADDPDLGAAPTQPPAPVWQTPAPGAPDPTAPSGPPGSGTPPGTPRPEAEPASPASAPTPSESAPPPGSPPTTPPSPPPARGAPGPLTRQFALPPQPGVTPDSSPSYTTPSTPEPSLGGLDSDDYLSRLESTAAPQPTYGSPPPPPPPAPGPPPTPAKVGPGEYTRIVQALPSEPPAPPIPIEPDRDPAATAKGPSRRVVIGVVVGAVVLTVIALVTVVVWTLVGPLLRPDPVEPAEDESPESPG